LSQQLTTDTILSAFDKTRSHTVELIQFLELEDINAQPKIFVSPPKWHLAHTTWFFEEFILKDQQDYMVFDPNHSFLYNSYYNAVGQRVSRDRRGVQTRPTLETILKYREHVDRAVKDIIRHNRLNNRDRDIIELGLAHEEQHQELLIMDAKYILGIQYLQPLFWNKKRTSPQSAEEKLWLSIPEGIQEIGFAGADFSFDNEHLRHKVLVHEFEISPDLVSNGEYLEFIESDEYNDPRH